LGPLNQKYVEMGKREQYRRVYIHKDGLMFGNKPFDVDEADNIIIDGVRYAGTCDLHELIFKRIPNDLHSRRYVQV